MTNGGFYKASASNIFGVQLYGIAAIVGWTAVTTVLFLGIAKVLGVLRVSESVEDKGLDQYYHNEDAEEFPDNDKMDAFRKMLRLKD